MPTIISPWPKRLDEEDPVMYDLHMKLKKQRQELRRMDRDVKLRQNSKQKPKTILRKKTAFA